MTDPIRYVLIGDSGLMNEVRELIRKAAPTDMTVLIHGESGTGKELVAEAIHRLSRRAKGPFVTMNCASLPESLIETELFGYKKGAFTGAGTDHAGKFELADGGTLFLDEIGELSLAAQAKLLRVLEKREIDRIGGGSPVSVDFRLIAATNRDLDQMAALGKFRPDLYYRLEVCTIRTPALRERPEDIVTLTYHFVFKSARRAGRVVCNISHDVMNLFIKYSWPGNVRQLQNVIQRVVFLGEGDRLELADVPMDFFQKTLLDSVKMGNYHKQMDNASRELVVQALKFTQGNAKKAAAVLGLNRKSLYRIAKRHGLGNLGGVPRKGEGS